MICILKNALLRTAAPLIVPQGGVPQGQVPSAGQPVKQPVQQITVNQQAPQPQPQETPQPADKMKHTVAPELPNPYFHMGSRGVRARTAAIDEGEGEAIFQQFQLALKHIKDAQSAGSLTEEAAQEQMYNARHQYFLRLDGLSTKESLSINRGPVFTDKKYDFTPEDKEELQRDFKVIARGGWHYVSQSTVQSDDKRFTVTIVDPTRRSKWFMLKDLETGETFQCRTMTEAKKKAKAVSEIEDAAESLKALDTVLTPGELSPEGTCNLCKQEYEGGDCLGCGDHISTHCDAGNSAVACQSKIHGGKYFGNCCCMTDDPKQVYCNECYEEKETRQ